MLCLLLISRKYSERNRFFCHCQSYTIISHALHLFQCIIGFTYRVFVCYSLLVISTIKFYLTYIRSGAQRRPHEAAMHAWNVQACRSVPNECVGALGIFKLEFEFQGVSCQPRSHTLWRDFGSGPAIKSHIGKCYLHTFVVFGKSIQ